MRTRSSSTTLIGIEWAFKAYASGNWSISQLHDELTSRGLLSLPTPRRPAKPLAVSSVHRLLTNPYYKGDLVYRGTRYKGNHPPLVPAEVWYQVQSVLTAHQCAVEATQVHGHYLKGTIHCGQCGSRLIVSNAKNRHGNVYCYFVCSGRHSKRTDCTRQAMLIEDVEKLVEDYYKRVQITPAQQDALAGMLHHEFNRLMAAETDELARLTANRDRLEGEQDRLMQAHYADAIPLSVLKREQDRITGELDKVTRRIDAHSATTPTPAPTSTTRSGSSRTAPTSTPAATTRTGGYATRPSSPRSTSMRTANCASSTTGPSKCCSTHRSTPTPSPGPQIPTRPEPPPTLMLARVRALCVGCSSRCALVNSLQSPRSRTRAFLPLGSIVCGA